MIHQALDRHAGRVLMLMAAWLGATAWLRPLMLPDEGRYVGVAREMLQSGDWLTPTLNGLPFFHKPPLFYWITASGLALFGTNEFAGRLASLLGGMTLAFSLFVFARRWMGAGAARAAMLVLLTQPMVYLGSQFANLDMLVAGCIGCTVLLLAHGLLCIDAGEPAGPALPAAYVAAALGVLAKGLIGVVLPASVVLAWLLAAGHWRRLPALWSSVGALAFAAIALPWFVAVQWRHPGFAHYFFTVQHLQRFTSGSFNNVQPWWFYPAVLLALTLPWSLWLLRVRGVNRDGPDRQRRSLRLLLWLWLAVVVLFFSLPQSKLIGYVLPALPPLCLLIADAAPAAPRGLRLWWASVAVAGLLCVGSVLWLSYHEPKTWRPLGLALQQRHTEGEPVIFAGAYFYDVAFYAHLRASPLVVAPWGAAEIAEHDDWRRALADGAAFAPASAASVLLTPQQVTPFLCTQAVAWVLATDTAAARQDWIRSGAVVQRWHGAALWRIDTAQARVARSLPCAAHGEDHL